jgi:tight adherence protein C
MLYVISGASFFSVFFLIYGVYMALNKDRLAISQRMKEAADSSRRKQVSDDEMSKPFFERIIKPILELLAASVGKATLAKKKVGLQKKLTMAGNPAGLTPSEFLVIQYVFTLGIPICVLLFALPLNWNLTVIILGMALGACAGFVLPGYYLKTRATQRSEEIQDNLPDVLDLLTVSVEAGLGFDAALVKVVEKIKGVVSQEFGRVLQEIKMGKPRRDALRDLGSRSGTDDMVSFVGSIIQADQLGVSIGNVLRLQSEQMRQKRRQRAEERALKAPVKMLIPLILFIFPTIFIVVLGPAALEIMNTFK